MSNFTRMLGKNIKTIRKSRNLLQSELAEKIGVEAKYLSRIETGLSTPSLKTIEKLVNVLDVKYDILFNFKEEENIEEIKEKIINKIKICDKKVLKIISNFIDSLDNFN